MNRLKLLATATLMALTFTACDEGTPPPVEPPPPPTPVGTISGAVTIEGTAASGITATLSSGATTTTGSGGNFAFSGVEAGTYTVTISGFPEDATFAQVTQPATIATDGQNVQLNFAGEYIRSSSVVGTVVAADAMMSGGDGQPETLAGVTVTLSGEHAMADPVETGMDGGFMFTGLRAGTYTVTISDFPEDVSFERVSMTVEAPIGDIAPAHFTGHFIRNSSVEGQVIIEGEGLAGVTVTLSGGPAEETFTTDTDAEGTYRFEDLRPGDYTVSISGFEPRDYDFAQTSRDIHVDLDDTETVDFTGVLLRTAGIAGSVTVGGIGLGDIAVTLSGTADDTTSTDASGLYSFAGLAAGDYTVSIAVESNAYVFARMAVDTTIVDEESAIVNFEGAHDTSASFTAMLFVDADEDNMHGEGEDPFPSAAMLQALQAARASLPPMLPVPVILTGPAVHEVRSGTLNVATGQVMFSDLRAGRYDLQVGSLASLLMGLPPEVVAVLRDYEYGGPSSGYPITIGVGEMATHAVPVDITHTTVHFSVLLKHGDETGDAVPGAAVTLYSDAAGETRIDGGETGDESEPAQIRIARAGTSGNMVYAGVSVDGYHVAESLTPVSWNPKSPHHEATNANDIVNLNVDASVSGATVTTDYGGGKALAGWAISVMSGEDAVEGAPAMLDDMGNAALTTTVGADALPATFTVAVAEDQDNMLDGGEKFEGTPVEYTHTGLKLAGTQDAGTIEVAYTTQTLKVYVHHERDQVKGYTGNILGGDVRDDGKVGVTLRYIDDSGRSRAFTAEDKVKSSSKDGVHTFSNVPAARNVIVQAADAQDPTADGYTAIKILDEGGHADELAAYTGMEANGITGSAFGANGGFGHTVELCPLRDTNPQDHGECASFAYVTTHTVSGLVWKAAVVRSGDDFEMKVPTFVAGQMVSLAPVEGKNIAGEAKSFTTAATDNAATPLNETHQFSFGGMAAGVYELGVPDGWRATTPAAGDDLGENSPMGATGMVGDAFNPLAGDVPLDVTPATGTLYGRVDGTDGFPLDSVVVTVNGIASAMTDEHGRYMVEGFGAVRGQVFVSASREGYQAAAADSTNNPGTEVPAFAMNAPARFDIDLAGVQARATISGTVRASGANTPVAGVEIKVDGAAPLNAPTSGANKGKLVTDGDGTYTAIVEAVELGETVTLSVSREGWTFVPASLSAPAHAGAEITGIDFTGFVNATISGRVIAPGGGPQMGVAVSATSTADATMMFADTTGVTGSFSLNVPFGSYTVAASLGNHTFGYPTTGQVVNVAPGQQVSFGDIEAKTAGALNVTAARQRVPDDVTTEDVDESEQRWGTGILVTYTANAENIPDGFNAPTYTIQTNTGTDGAWTGAIGTTPVQRIGDNNLPVEVPGNFRIATPAATSGGDGEFMVRVVTAATETTPSDPAAPFADTSATATVAAVDPTASEVTVTRQSGPDTPDPGGDYIEARWTAVTNERSDFRVVAEVTAASVGGTVWVVLEANIDANDRDAVADEIGDNFSQALPVAFPSGTGSSVTVTAADLRKAIKVAVESVQGTADATETGPKWKRSAVVDVAARTSGS